MDAADRAMNAYFNQVIEAENAIASGGWAGLPAEVELLRRKVLYFQARCRLYELVVKAQSEEIAAPRLSRKRPAEEGARPAKRVMVE